ASLSSSSLSLHDALPISNLGNPVGREYSSASGLNDAGEIAGAANIGNAIVPFIWTPMSGVQRIPLLPGDNCGQAFSINQQGRVRSEEHTSELQSRSDLVC